MFRSGRVAAMPPRDDDHRALARARDALGIARQELDELADMIRRLASPDLPPTLARKLREASSRVADAAAREADLSSTVPDRV